MIREDRLWKAQIGLYIEKLEAEIAKPFLNSEEVEFEIEHLHFVLAASARKLLESHCVPDDLGKQNIRIRKFSPTGTPITFQSRNSLSRCYKMEAPISGLLQLKDMLNYIIHGYVSHVGFDTSDGTSAFSNRIFFIVSDYDKNKFLLCVEFKEFFSALMKFSHAPYYSPLRYEADQQLAKLKGKEI